MSSTVAQFDIQYIQLLNEQGVLSTAVPACVDDAKQLVSLYRSMQLTRQFDDKAIALQRMGKLGTYAPCHGQEAIGTAIGHLMQAEDVLIPYYRDYAALAQRGVAWSEMLTYWGGDERGNHFEDNQTDLPFCVPIASQCLHAAGIAFSFKYREEARVAVVCLGDGGTSEGDFYEAMNVAGAWHLPLIFVINNNQWAISVPLSAQTHTQTLAQKAIAAGFEGIQVDGNDVLGLCDVLQTALDKARRGGGPTLIEALTYRLSNHTTADDATRYQPSSDVQQATQREPLRRFKRFLEHHLQWSDTQEQQLLHACASTINEAIDTYLARPPQPLAHVFDYHFETLPAALLEQRATLIEEATHG